MYDLTATGLGRFCGMDRRTMVGVLNGRPVSMPTMLTLMDYFGNPGEPIEALFEPIPAGDGYRRPGK